MSNSPSPALPPAHVAETPVLHLSELLKRPVTDSDGHVLGRLADVVVRLRGNDYPLVTALVLAVPGRRVFVPMEQVASFAPERLVLASARVSLRPFERRDGEVLLRADVLGHRLVDVERGQLVRPADIELAYAGGTWLVSCVDIRSHRRGRGLFRRGAAGHACRDWKSFEPLIGHTPSALVRGPGRLRGLKAAQLADLLEDARKHEESEILGRVHEDPELEADVFEELEDDQASRLLAAKSDAEIAAVLARMRADDAADALGELPQARREPVLGLLPTGQRVKVRTLMGFNPTSAGGMMNLDFLAVPGDTAVAEALAAVARSRNLQSEALTSVYVVDAGRRLTGAARLVALVQADPVVTVSDVADPDPVRARPDSDIEDVALRMADYNLFTLPVVDDDNHLLGVITVDDVLENVLPDDWRRREPPQPDTGEAHEPEPGAGQQALHRKGEEGGP
ncbi:CBS domain-containing protein [Saccharomonospora sp. NPDC046836]|uniref:magnesium transporter MgtE N-terminal domain-containing protein n=1 Tax=Saccharomonospora sp. NPDC046836 TaxID=3156921 RepID=UPI0033C2B579